MEEGNLLKTKASIVIDHESALANKMTRPACN